MTGPVAVAEATIANGTLRVVVTGLDNDREAVAAATLRDLNGRSYPLPLVSGATAGQMVGTADIAVPPPGSDAPSYVLTIAGADYWFAPSSTPSHARDAGERPVPRAGSGDYGGRDFAFFVATMRAALTRSIGGDAGWALDHPADPMTTLIEALAFGADHLSYRQDAAGTEAYLPTARRRTSLRRHARMRDYAVNDGCSARTPLVLTVARDGHVPVGTAAVTLQPGTAGVPIPAQDGLTTGTTVFETIEPLAARAAVNDLGPALPPQTLATGATSLELGGAVPPLRPGALLVLRQRDAPAGGAAFETWMIRLLTVEARNGTAVLRWHPEDALPRALTIPPAGQPGVVALSGNVVLADHGRTVAVSAMLPPVGRARYRAELALTDPVMSAPAPAPGTVSAASAGPLAMALSTPSARACLMPDPRSARLALTLTADGPGAAVWSARHDLLDMPGGAACFAASLAPGPGDGPQRVQLCFGDDRFGRRPQSGTRFAANARTGDGMSGRIDAGALVQLYGAPAFVTGVTNPFAAAPIGPEADAAVRIFAASDFTLNARGIDPDDWRRLAMADPLVRDAQAAPAPDGGGPCTIGLAVAPPADLTFPLVRGRLLQAAVLGATPTIVAAAPVAAVLALTVYCRPGASPDAVRSRLGQAFGSGLAPDGGPAYFHPDRWPLGRSIELVDLVAALDADRDVIDVITDGRIDPRLRFERADARRTTGANLRAGRIAIGPHEQLRLASGNGLALYVVAS